MSDTFKTLTIGQQERVCIELSAAIVENEWLTKANAELREALADCERAMSMHNDSSNHCTWDFGPAHGGSLSKARKALANADKETGR